MSSRVWQIFAKELKEVLRDRRTLAATFLLPILVYPVMLLIVAGMMSIQTKRMAGEVRAVGVYPASLAPTVARWRYELEQADRLRRHAPSLSETGCSSDSKALKETNSSPLPFISGASRRPTIVPLNRTVLKGLDDPLEKDREKAVERLRGILLSQTGVAAAIVFDTNSATMNDSASGRKPIRVNVFYDSTNIRSMLAASGAREILSHGGRQLACARAAEMKKMLETLDAAGLDEKSAGTLEKILSNTQISEDGRLTFLEPLRISEENADVATPVSRKGFLLGALLPMIVVLLIVVSCVHPAIDMVAGERERGTLETLLVCPVPTSTIVAGKFLAIMTLSLISAVLNIASMGMSLSLVPIPQLTAAGTPWLHLAAMLFMMIPPAFLFSALWMTIASVAADYREAQAYISPGIVLCVLPTQIALIPGVELEGGWLYLPVGNIVLLGRDLITGNAEISKVLFVFASTSVYAIVAIILAVQLFGREEVLFSTGGARMLLKRTLLRMRPRPSPGEALVVLIVAFIAFLYGSAWLPRLFGGVEPNSTEAVLRSFRLLPLVQGTAFIAWPLAFAWYFKLRPKDTFLLRTPVLKRHWLGLIPAVAGAILVTNILGAVLSKLTGGPDEQTRALAGQIDQALKRFSLPEILLLFAVVPALCEEFLFRGMLLSGLSGGRESWKPIVSTALLFGAFHLQPYRIVTTAMMGLLLAFLALRSRSLLLVVAAHFLNNAAGMLISWGESHGWWSLAGWEFLDPSSTAPVPYLKLLGLFSVGLALLSIGLAFFRKSDSSAE